MGRIQPKRVAITYTGSTSILAKNLRGIAAYARAHGNWYLVYGSGPDAGPIALEDLRGWEGDGVIALLNTRRDEQVAQRLGVPVVNVSWALRHSALPRTPSDHSACGRLAAEHLLERGFRRFGYCGVERAWFSKLFEDGFATKLSEHGAKCTVLDMPSAVRQRRSIGRDGLEIERWLQSLPKPVGIMACNDPRARMLAEACERLGLQVPEAVGIIGVSNNELACEFCNPPLTSIDRDGERFGWEAAALLDRLMRGKRPPESAVEIAPIGVVQRVSTDVEVISDPLVAEAAKLIRERVKDLNGVSDVVRRLTRSRRCLEHRFRACLGLSPHEYLCRTRVNQAKRLLIDPGRQLLKQIAHRCGFRDLRHFRMVFQRLQGVSPAQYRRRQARLSIRSSPN